MVNLLNNKFLKMVSYSSLLCVFLSCLVLGVLVNVLFFVSGSYVVKVDNQVLEFSWTFIPTFWVGFLCLFKVNLGLMDVEGIVSNTIKIMGRQWYWTYEYSFNGNMLDYDSYISGLIKEVDNPLQVIYGKIKRLLITSSDVIHSFFVPDLLMKMDAIPGRINQVIAQPLKVGSFTGYCSELCGVGHSYMPIVVECVLSDES